MMPEPADPLVVRAALPPAFCARVSVAIDDRAAQLDAGHSDLQPTSGSLRLRALPRALFAEALRGVLSGPAGAALRARLGASPLCLAGQCWARRQYPPALRPRGQHPHDWHQDGALGCTFASPRPGEPAETLLDLTTVWIPLLDCGADAPSLEWIDASPPGLLTPADLDDAALGRRFGLPARRHARLSAGDALVFGGALLHRSHVTASMSRRRVSIELRFVAAPPLPPRLAHEVLVVAPV